MSEFTLRKADNYIEAEGYLDSKKLECKSFTYKDKDGNDATIEKIMGEIVVEVNELTKVKFRVDVNRFSKSGEQTKIYDKALAIMNEYVAKSDCATNGRPLTDADRVKVKGSFDHRDHLNGDKTEFWSYGVYKFTFAERVDQLNFTPHARFNVEMYTESIEDEVKNDVPTGAIFVNGIVPLFNSVIPLRLRYATTVDAEGKSIDLAAYIKENFDVGKTFKTYGEIVGEVNSSESKQTLIGAQQTFETISVKPVVTTITPQYLITDPKHFDKDAIKSALGARQEKLDKIKANMVNGGATENVIGATPNSAPATPVTNTERTLNW